MQFSMEVVLTQGQVYQNEEQDKYELRNITAEFTLYDLFDKLLNLDAQEPDTVVVTKADCDNYKTLESSELRIVYNEVSKQAAATVSHLGYPANSQRSAKSEDWEVIH
ncbi:unnamed protein product [Echinostoma caproni]|uniref:Ubiquitin-like domain-containing protein n=1 Tax=Echinostoma caproni TaxID=27848 RepID=A0A183AX56_9TREM|nr:unnamed protein product [Echinostoma caproni]